MKAFLPAELILKKRRGGTHTHDELHFLVQQYSHGKIPDYQMSAWLMAVCFRGMTPEETSAFTVEIRDSGQVLDFSSLGISVDKHSTGGLGDKTSLILAPIVAEAGVPVPMIAGRGLGHTGGTLDKLEAIAGFNVQLDLARFQKQVATLGVAIIGQTPEICPADRKLYALRDVTGTVDSLPLICASIMSKKLAEGISALVLDVKFGSGAFMKSQVEAEQLARNLMSIGRQMNKQVVALLTNMNEPLGRYVGNSLEVRECVDILNNRTCSLEGKGYEDTRELTLRLAGHMIHLGQKAASAEDGYKIAQNILTTGRAWTKFQNFIKAQGGTLEGEAPHSRLSQPVYADRTGFMHFMDLEKLGLAAIVLGAGRSQQSDTLHYEAGIEVLVKNGQAISVGQSLMILHFNEDNRLLAALPLLNASYKISEQAQPLEPLIAKVLT